MELGKTIKEKAQRKSNSLRFCYFVVVLKTDGNVTINVSATPPSISVAATTLAAGSSATVTKSGTDASPTFTFGIPKGDKGDRGPQGPQGPTGASGTKAFTYGTSDKTAGSSSLTTGHLYFVYE